MVRRFHYLSSKFLYRIIFPSGKVDHRDEKKDAQVRVKTEPKDEEKSLKRN